MRPKFCSPCSEATQFSRRGGRLRSRAARWASGGSPGLARIAEARTLRPPVVGRRYRGAWGGWGPRDRELRWEKGWDPSGEDVLPLRGFGEGPQVEAERFGGADRQRRDVWMPRVDQEVENLRPRFSNNQRSKSRTTRGFGWITRVAGMSPSPAWITSPPARRLSAGLGIRGDRRGGWDVPLATRHCQGLGRVRLHG